MGLPIFITPVEPEVASKAAEKIASGPRSSIRRQRTLRGPHARLTSEARRRRIMGLMPEAEPEDFEVLEGQHASLPNEIELPSPASLQSRALRMAEQGRIRMRDPVSFERQHWLSSDVDGPLMPPVPESRDYSVTEERDRELYRLSSVRRDLRRIGRRHPAPTPPYTDSEMALLSRTDSPRLSASATPVLSPSHQRSVGDGDSPPRRPLEDHESSFTARPPYTDSIGRSSLTDRVQALNRTSRYRIERERVLARQARMDGLGDRDRSLSPEGNSASAWDTLLTSITPDPQPPSAGSSFASTSAAAAAASSAGSGPSSGSSSASASTSMTSVDRTGEQECDVSESGSNTEDEEDIYELHEFNGSRGGGGDRFWRTYADAVTTRADRAARDSQDLGGMHRIISSLARRDEIPDNWWASAGLSRNLRREPTN